MRFQYYLKAGLGAAALAAAACSGAATAQEQAPVFVDQGKDWKDPALRQAFYIQDQGSRIMPLAWMKALKRPDGQPFLAGLVCPLRLSRQPGERRRPAGRISMSRRSKASSPSG